jgi:hypothetical protein
VNDPKLVLKLLCYTDLNAYTKISQFSRKFLKIDLIKFNKQFK